MPHNLSVSYYDVLPIAALPLFSDCAPLAPLLEELLVGKQDGSFAAGGRLKNSPCRFGCTLDSQGWVIPFQLITEQPNRRLHP